MPIWPSRAGIAGPAAARAAAEVDREHPAQALRLAHRDAGSRPSGLGVVVHRRGWWCGEDEVAVACVAGKDAVIAHQMTSRTGYQCGQAGNDKSAGLPIWTTAGRPKGGAQGCAPSIRGARTGRGWCRRERDASVRRPPGRRRRGSDAPARWRGAPHRRQAFQLAAIAGLAGDGCIEREAVRPIIASMAPAATSSITANSQPSPQPEGTKKVQCESTPTIAFDRE